MSRVSEKPAGKEFAFRLDAPIRARVFAEELQISGWLLHRGGEPIHGIRCVVKRRLSRDRVWKARRKRSRPDAAAAFPDLPGAKSSGFLLQVPSVVRRESTPPAGPRCGSGLANFSPRQRCRATAAEGRRPRWFSARAQIDSSFLAQPFVFRRKRLEGLPIGAPGHRSSRTILRDQAGGTFRNE